MIFMALNLADREFRAVEQMFKLSRQMPLIFLPIVLTEMACLSHFLPHQIFQPLNSFVACAIRIAQGDFSPITNTKKYKDEFSRLAMAIDWMIDQLKKNQEQYIQSRKMTVNGSLASRIAHELNNPLKNICITAEPLLNELVSNGERRKCLQDICTQAEWASTVCNPLDFTGMDEPYFSHGFVDELFLTTLLLARNE